MNYALLFALHREAAPFLRRHRDQLVAEAWPAIPPCDAHRLRFKSKSVTVLVTGMGFESAAKAIEWILVTHECDLVIAAGFAGALDSALQVGDVVVASEIAEDDGEVWRTALPAELGDRDCGRLLTARRLIGTPAEKRVASRSQRAVAVDMESAAIAEVCQGARIPCAVVRAISDRADTALSPPLAEVLTAGRISTSRLIGTILRRPLLVRELWRLARDTRRAAHNLADALDLLMS